MISARSARIGVYTGLCGISQMWPSAFLSVLTVASRSAETSLSSRAATMSPLLASGWRRTTTQSPSAIAASIIESPVTRSAMRLPSPVSSRGRGMTYSAASALTSICFMFEYANRSG
jgi:hypothetical protein